MNELKILVVAIAGGMFVQSIDPLPVVCLPTDSVNEMVIRMLVSVAGGIISTMAFKVVQLLPWRKLARRFNKKQMSQKH